MSLTELFPDPVLTTHEGPAARLGILYEHPAWFERLFYGLDRRGVPYAKLLAPEHFYDPATRDDRFGLIFNRMSPSADRREHGAASFTLNPGSAISKHRACG
jgi:hypothetical protein